MHNHSQNFTQDLFAINPRAVFGKMVCCDRQSKFLHTGIRIEEFQEDELFNDNSSFVVVVETTVLVINAFFL